MEEEGMTDLQFKSFLRQLVGRLETIKETSEPQVLAAKLDELITDLKEDIEN